MLAIDIAVHPDAELHYLWEYGDLYRKAQYKVRAALNKPIASMFALPRSDKTNIKTEVLFVERCLDLLKPHGRLGIVLPEGIFNNPSLAYVREFIEDRAFLRAVVSLPQDTFVSSGASVKCSLLFLQKFTEGEKKHYESVYTAAKVEVDARFATDIEAERERLEMAIKKAKRANQTGRRKSLQKELRDYLKEMNVRRTVDARQLLRERFDYPIFMYEAEKVGITATGEEDENELYPNSNQLSGSGNTCLESYRDFLSDLDA